MIPGPRFWRPREGGVDINVYIQPRASRNQVCGVHDGSLKLRITAPPVGGQANNEVIRFLSKTLKIAKTKLTIRQGQSGRNKLIHIACTPSERPGLFADLKSL